MSSTQFLVKIYGARCKSKGIARKRKERTPAAQPRQGLNDGSTLLCQNAHLISKEVNQHPQVIASLIIAILFILKCIFCASLLIKRASIIF
ncbi:MAG: hypothetical protein EZS28_006740 [Streblomastix strix]|uniref:Uncharacterized protein n=1 Tax=Streblomastix strix TaxID=222440 RepID=A0A5J4WRI3_9EUKA|nr:MAG: hypothetical protein EZS28_006740 [Streblomastix strix]